MNNPQKIIIRMPNWIGDLVMATPIFAEVANRYPQAEITAMCRRPICQLLEKDPHIDELFCFSKSGLFTRRQERRNIVQTLQKGRYDLGILLPNSFSSAWLFWQGKVKRRLGYSGHFRRLLLTDPLQFPEHRAKQHLVTTYKMLLQPLGIPLSESPPQVYVSNSEKIKAKDLLRSYGVEEGDRILGVNPGAAYGSAKCWPAERFALLCHRLLAEDQNLSMILFGDQQTAETVKKICKNLPKKAINLAGLTSLRELMALIGSCDAFLTNDSGPMHIASALNVPVVALFGSTDETVTGPYAGGKILNKHVSCSPCFKRTCPIDFRCMQGIRVEEVQAAVKSTITRGKNDVSSPTPS